MSQPQSMVQDRWTDFPQFSYLIFNSDFVHKRWVNLRFTSSSDKCSTRLRIASRYRSHPIEYGSDFSFLWKLPNDKALCAKFKSNNYLKLHYDHGMIERNDQKWNLYGSVNATHMLHNASVRVGAHLIAKDYQTDSRVKIDFLQKNKNQYTWYNRSVYQKNKVTLGALLAFNFSKLQLLKNNFLAGYDVNETTSVFCRIQNQGFRDNSKSGKSIGRPFDMAYLDIVSSYQKKIKGGLEIAYSFDTKQISEITSVAEYQHKQLEQTYKIKVNQLSALSLLWKFKTRVFGDMATHSIGMFSSSVLKGDPWLCGFQTEFNI